MKTVIEMANEAGLEKVSSGWRAWTKDLAQFAELVRADEREACAKVADGFIGCNAIVHKIRARSNT